MIGANYRELSLSYRHFSTLVNAGISITDALQTISQGAQPELRTRADLVVRRVRAGAFLHAAASFRPPIETAILKAGEASGQLPEALKFLSDYYEEKHQIEKSVKHALGYPGLLFVMSVFLRDLPAVFGGTLSITWYLVRAIVTIAVVAAAVYGLFEFFRRSNRSAAAELRSWRLLHRIPWVGVTLETIMRERYFTCLNLCFRSGCDLDTSLEIASSSVASPSLKLATKLVRERQGTMGFAKAMETTGAFSNFIMAEIRAAEAAGSLDEAFRKISLETRDELQTAINRFKEWLPKIVYIIAALYVVSGIFSTLSSIRDPMKSIKMD